MIVPCLHLVRPQRCKYGGGGELNLTRVVVLTSDFDKVRKRQGKRRSI